MFKTKRSFLISVCLKTMEDSQITLQILWDAIQNITTDVLTHFNSRWIQFIVLCTKFCVHQIRWLNRFQRLSSVSVQMKMVLRIFRLRFSKSKKRITIKMFNNAVVTTSDYCTVKLDILAENKYVVCERFTDMFSINTYYK